MSRIDRTNKLPWIGEGGTLNSGTEPPKYPDTSRDLGLLQDFGRMAQERMAAGYPKLRLAGLTVRSEGMLLQTWASTFTRRPSQTWSRRYYRHLGLRLSTLFCYILPCYQFYSKIIWSIMIVYLQDASLSASPYFLHITYTTFPMARRMGLQRTSKMYKHHKTTNRFSRICSSWSLSVYVLSHSVSVRGRL